MYAPTIAPGLQALEAHIMTQTTSSSIPSVNVHVAPGHHGEFGCEADYDAWVSYVCAHIDEECHVDAEVTVEDYDSSGVCETSVSAKSNDVRESVNRWLAVDGWEEFCSDTTTRANASENENCLLTRQSGQCRLCTVDGMSPAVKKEDKMTNHIAYEISNKISGQELGVYEAASEDGALDALARDAGYADYDAACAAVGGRGELAVTPKPAVR
jgi:hypothetical protein